MIKREQTEEIREKYKELRESCKPVIKELIRPVDDYSSTWDYAAQRRIKEGKRLIDCLNYLETVAPWLESQGLLNIDVTRKEGADKQHKEQGLDD